MLYKTSVPKEQLEHWGFPVPIDGDELWFYWTFKSQKHYLKLISDEKSGYSIPGNINAQEVHSVPVYLFGGFQHYEDFDLTPDDIGEALYAWFYDECPDKEKFNSNPVLYFADLYVAVMNSIRRADEGPIDPFGIRPKKEPPQEAKRKSAKSKS